MVQWTKTDGSRVLAHPHRQRWLEDAFLLLWVKRKRGGVYLEYRETQGNDRSSKPYPRPAL